MNQPGVKKLIVGRVLGIAVLVSVAAVVVGTAGLLFGTSVSRAVFFDVDVFISECADLPTALA